MGLLRYIWHDISSGENIDLYVSLLVAVTMSVLSLLGVVPDQYITPLILTTLTLLLISNLVSRTRVDGVSKKVEQLRLDSLQTMDRNRILQTRPERPPMEQRLSSVQETLDMLGASLQLFGVTYQAELRRLRDSGKKVRLIVSNPDNYALQTELAMIFSEAPTAEQHKRAVEMLLGSVKPLAGETHSEGRIDVRITDQSVRFGYIGIDAYSSHGGVQVEFYLNRIPLSRNPILVFSAPTDSRWLAEFRNQFEFYWEHSRNPFEVSESAPPDIRPQTASAPAIS